MSDDPKNISQKPDAGTPSGSSGLILIFALALTLLFIGGIYFDAHSGWFDSQVYAPYKTADQLEAYQPKSGAAAVLAQGKLTYDTICAACHGPNGEGKPNQAPPLAGSPWVNAKGNQRLAMIPQLGLNGQVQVEGQTWNLSMPPMGAGLSDSDLAAVLTYIRSSWGNKAAPVTPDDVKAIRAKIAGHPAINGEQQLNSMPE